MYVYELIRQTDPHKIMSKVYYRALDNTMSVGSSGGNEFHRTSDSVDHHTTASGGMMGSGSYMANNLYHPGSGYNSNQCPQGIDDSLALMFVTMSSALGMYVIWRQYSHDRLANPLDLQLRKKRDILGEFRAFHVSRSPVRLIISPSSPFPVEMDILKPILRRTIFI